MRPGSQSLHPAWCWVRGAQSQPRPPGLIPSPGLPRRVPGPGQRSLGREPGLQAAGVGRGQGLVLSPSQNHLLLVPHTSTPTPTSRSQLQNVPALTTERQAPGSRGWAGRARHSGPKAGAVSIPGASAAGPARGSPPAGGFPRPITCSSSCHSSAMHPAFKWPAFLKWPAGVTAWLSIH